ncbi:MAG: hypothetical protein SH848_02555, partial [Saprospiraceae bacterium]|nr:hypothetical protein [Saprospiraceae bacterium]MDZ4702781.1 hypothetical protein [Saprospiraceae bacterium]
FKKSFCLFSKATGVMKQNCLLHFAFCLFTQPPTTSTRSRDGSASRVLFAGLCPFFDSARL